MDLVTVLVFFAVFLFTVWFLSGPRNKNLPPGPPGWPIIGNVWGVRTNTKYYLEITELAKQYGNIFSLRYGNRPVVVLNGSKVIKEAFVDKADYFSDRPDNMYLTKFLTKNAGIMFNTHNWRGMRRMALVALKDFGLGKSSLESRCQEEVTALMEVFSGNEGRPFSCQALLRNAISNIICSVTFGNRFSYEDKTFAKLMAGIETLFRQNNMYAISNFIPWVTPFVLMKSFISPSSRSVMKTLSFIKEFIYGSIREHRETYDPDQIRDFVDLYIQAEKSGELSEVDAMRIIIDLFVAGTETTSTALQWLIVYMIHHPEIQTRCRQEIHVVLGKTRLPATKDRASLIYTEATLKELLRHANIGPLSIPHTSSGDVELGGFTIPKGTHIIANLYSANMDPTIWHEPHKFSPERWIGGDGKLINSSAYLPFSTGRRVCLGEQLARLELFIFGVTLLQRFEFREADEKPSLDGEQTLTLVPKYFEFLAIKT